MDYVNDKKNPPLLTKKRTNIYYFKHGFKNYSDIMNEKNVPGYKVTYDIVTSKL